MMLYPPLFLLFVCFSLAFAVAPGQAENLLVNGDMEAGPWQHTTYAGTSAVRSWATDSSHSPFHALKTTSSGRIFVGWMAAAVPVTPGTAYQVAIWGRTEAITDGIYLNVSWRDGQGSPVQWSGEVGGRLQGTQSWQQLTGGVTAPSQARQAVVEVRILSDRGTAWLDDALLTPVTQPPPPPAFDVVLAALPPLTVTQGATVSTEVVMTHQAGTAQPVTLTVSHLPPDVTASWSSTSCTPSCTSVLTLRAAATAALGVTTVTVVATGPMGSRSTSFPLTVVAGPAPVTQAIQNTRWERTLTSTQTYANPFTDVTVSVEYTKQGSATIRSMAFWDSGNTFKIRMAFPETGSWTYHTTSSDTSNTGLHNQTGTVQVTAYTGTNPLYQHGFLRVSADKRSLEHADGSPFFWLGDTLWGATVWLSENGFYQAIDDLVAKRFTVLQTNFARKSEVDMNGMVPYDNASERWNVAFMQRLDREFNYANDQGIFLFLNGLIDLKWDRGIQDWDRLVRMIAARYAGHCVSWSSSMDDPYSTEQDAVGQAIAAVDDRHLITQHGGSDSVDPACNPRLSTNVCTAQLYQSQSYVDYTMFQSGGSSFTIIEGIKWLYNFSPTKPIVVGEAGYEEVDATAEHTTRQAYFTLLSGAGGYSHGTIYWDADDSDLSAWAALPGRTYLSYLAPFWRSIDGGRALIPRAELVTNQASSYDEKMLVAATKSGAKYVAYLPVGGTISINLSAVSGPLAVSWFDPLSGHTLGNSTAQGEGVRSFTSPWGSRQSVLVLSSE